MSNASFISFKDLFDNFSTIDNGSCRYLGEAYSEYIRFMNDKKLVMKGKANNDSNRLGCFIKII
jgi:hypothetical protein